MHTEKGLLRCDTAKETYLSEVWRAYDEDSLAKNSTPKRLAEFL